MKLVLLFIALVFAGCSTYHPLKDGIGFTEIPVGDSEFQVTYHGDSDMGVAQARQFALTRSAELAALRGMPYFLIENERVILTNGTTYVPGYSNTFVNRTGRGRAFVESYYSPDYLEYYTVPEVWMQIKLQSDGTGPAIPAGYILRQAEASKVKLSPGVAELVPSLPAGPATIPPPPKAVTRPAPK